MTASIQHKFEPLVEVHQAKGNSEVTAAFWPNDEFANYENYAYEGASQKDYVRDALKRGLKYEDEFGVNPFKFGLIGSTDTHNGIPGNTEEWGDFIGNHSLLDNNAWTRRHREWILEFGSGKMVYDALNPGGLVAVWAEANTRGDIFDALRRKETYATSGGRIKVRFFGGYGFQENYDNYETMVKDGYEKGVAMGGDINLSAYDKEAIAPSFLIWASKDPEGANLDRIQVIKGWYKDGELSERIFNVALSDDRLVGTDGSAPKTEAAVNLSTGEWDKTKGATVLQTVWSDPEFDPSARAFYYLRVIENPTPRYTLWDKIRHGETYPKDIPLITQERARSSPIWVNP